jgi:hypothetical protein
MTFTKRAGHCMACGTPTFEIRERQEPSGTRLEVLRLGPMLDEGTQVEMLLSDGSCVHLDFCVGCASKLTPDDYLDAWEAVLDRTEERLATTRPNERQRKVQHLARLWPMAVLRWRRQDPATGRIVPDRRYDGVVKR